MKKISIIPISLFLLLGAGACKDGLLRDFVIQPDFEKEMVIDPLVSAQAYDGSAWNEGEIDGRSVTFGFRTLDKEVLERTMIRLVLKEGASMVNPSSTEAVIDMSSPYVVSISNGYNPVEYILTAKKIQLLKSVSIRVGGETYSGYPDEDGRIVLTVVAADVSACELELSLIEGVEPLSPSSVTSVQDLSVPFTISLRDTYTQKNTEYILELKHDWFDVTESYDMLPSFVKVFKTETLHSRPGNIGYVVKIPSGKISMETSFKVDNENTWFIPAQRLSEVVANNGNFYLFTGGQNVVYTKPIIRTLALNRGSVADDGTGNAAFAWHHWNIRYYTCPPTLGISGGKAAIHYAEVLDDGRLYSFGTPKHGEDKSAFSDGTPWPVSAAVSGYSLPLKNRELRIGSESEAEYLALADIERNHSFNNVRQGMQINNFKINYQGENTSNLSAHLSDGLRMARNMFGVNSEGDLFLFVSERYSNNSNVLVNPDDPSDGSTLREAASVMKEFGCTDAMALFQIQFSIVSLQNGSYGTDLTRTIGRTGLSGGEDIFLSTVVMFRDPTPDEGDYGEDNHAGGNLSEEEYP